MQDASVEVTSELTNKFLDNTYWRIDGAKKPLVDIDELFSELESSDLNNNTKFFDNNYWRIGEGESKTVDIDQLITELEGF